MQPFDIHKIRKDFPALAYCNSKNQPIAYLDNSATTQKPQSVIDSISDFYLHYNANVHRSFYVWGERSTEAYEGVRARIARFIDAASPNEIVFTRGATESLNCLAEIIGQRYFNPGDEVIVSELEHHSNLIPWQIQQYKRGIKVKLFPINTEGDLELATLDRLLTPKTKLLTLTHISNVLGTVPDMKAIIARAHANGTLVVVDAAQTLAHLPISVRNLDCDFLVASGHKTYGPTGSGFFYGKQALLETLPPYHGGGTMMQQVTADGFTPADIPLRFEAGTPPIADIIGMGAAIDYLQQFSWDAITAHEDSIIRYTEKTLKSIPQVQVLGHPKHRTAVVPFILNGVHPHDAAQLMSNDNVAIRGGYHCSQPLIRRLQCLNGGVLRASFGIYNTCEDVDRLAQSIEQTLKFFRK